MLNVSIEDLGGLQGRLLDAAAKQMGLPSRPYTTDEPDCYAKIGDAGYREHLAKHFEKCAEKIRSWESG